MGVICAEEVKCHQINTEQLVHAMGDDICEETELFSVEVPNINVGHGTSSYGVDHNMMSTHNRGAAIIDAGSCFAVVVAQTPVVASLSWLAPRGISLVPLPLSDSHPCRQ